VDSAYLFDSCVSVKHDHRKKLLIMHANTEISRIAIVGTGLVGGSWAACFLAHGLDVVATDPAPGAEDKLRHCVEAAWPTLTKIGLTPGASTSRLRFESDLKKALAGAQMVQENAPEREPLKIKLFADMDSILPPPAILVSSTSGIPMSHIQSECKYPERCVTGHPFNPPHLVPLVEVVGGAQTSAETIKRAMRFYAAMGKRALHIRKEIRGHVANRLQAALYREVAYLIDQDVVSVADADAAVCMGPGLRWALMGPNLIYHLGGGPGGIRHFFDHFTGLMTGCWADLGSPELSPELQKKIVDGVLQEVDGRSFEELSQERDRLMMGLLELVSHRGKTRPVAASGHPADDS
jgi:3-hydroxyacyl-CoA dehydrogenase